MKKAALCLLAGLAFAACAPVASPPPPVVTHLNAALPATLPPTTLQEPSPTSVPLTITPVPCDPFSVDFCIEDGHFLFHRPIHSPDNDSVERTYPFGSTDGGRREVHHGVEFINATGTPVYAAGEGTILFAGPDKEAVFSPWKNFYGNVIIIRHSNDLFTLYAHLSKIDVQLNQQVEAGEKIGEVGKTGGAIGSHLHFEVRMGDVENYLSGMNPELWLIPREGEGVLSISILDGDENFKKADITIQTDGASYFINTYREKFPSVGENAALGELLPGRYRITFYSGAQFFERWVDIQAGKLTRVVFLVK
jgi:hypothetical protein